MKKNPINIAVGFSRRITTTTPSGFSPTPSPEGAKSKAQGEALRH
jgi:hypothetical protein